MVAVIVVVKVTVGVEVRTRGVLLANVTAGETVPVRFGLGVSVLPRGLGAKERHTNPAQYSGMVAMITARSRMRRLARGVSVSYMMVRL